MTRRQKKKVGIVLGVLVAFGACYVAMHPARWYQGGPIIDNGVVSYPRFIARFEAIEFSRAESYSYEFRRFPADNATVLLRTPSAPKAEVVEALTTEITLEVEDQDGSIRCSASGFPAGLYTEGTQAFVQSTPRHAEGIWLMGCTGFSLEKCNPCRLTVTISNVDPATPAMPLIPTIQGGGIELP